MELMAALPSLHLTALQLLTTLLSVGGTALVPHFGPTTQLLGDLLRQCAGAAPPPPGVRLALHQAVQGLLLRAGVGAALGLSEPLLQAILVETYGGSVTAGETAIWVWCSG